MLFKLTSLRIEIFAGPSRLRVEKIVVSLLSFVVNGSHREEDDI